MPKLPYPPISPFGFALIALILAINLVIEGLHSYLIPVPPFFDFAAGAMPSYLGVAMPGFLGLWYGTTGIPWAELPGLVTYGYAHVGWDHLAFNMVPFVPLAWLTARRCGTVGLFLLYHGLMVAAAAVHLWSDMMSLFHGLDTGTNYGLLVGASGGVHGLGGLWVTWAWRDRVGTLFHRLWPAVLWLGFMIGVNTWLIVVFDWGFAWVLHLAGVVIGMMVALVIPARRAVGRKTAG